MPLEVGSRLGHYQVDALIGEGGMGQVYQATDTKLGRQVALKILPEAFASDPDRLARFQREAQVLASLNHPNIAAIHGLEESDGQKALVLELVEGPTLADRIAQGPIPVDEALPIAKQIAEALEAAHEQGVIHRDLKPANIKLRDDGTVKVLDFGLAKALDTGPEGDPSQSPTLTAAATQMGVIMGTAAYMSPEQARGRAVDKQADIWSFGCVLYEVLTGQRAFQGEDVSLTLAEVMKSEPDFDNLPFETTPGLRSAIERCLAKDPKQRIRDVGDVRLAMEGGFESQSGKGHGEAANVQRWRPALPWAVALVAVVAGLAGWMASPPSESVATRFQIGPPPGVDLVSSFLLSPDGRTIVFHGVSGDTGRVYRHSLDQLEVAPIRGTDGAFPVAFSPDGQQLLVSDADVGARTTVMRLPLSGGLGTEVAVGQSGADWGDDGNVLLGGIDGIRLVRLPSREETVLTSPTPGEIGHYQPVLLPNGRAMLFFAWGGTEETTQVAVYDFETGERANLVSGTTPVFAASGHLVYWRDGSLWAVPFDPDRLELVGDSGLVVEGVDTRFGAYFAEYSLSDTGNLVYQPAGTSTQSTLGWVDRTGQMTASVLSGFDLGWPRLSPDGRLLAFSRRSQSGADLWIREFESGQETRLTVTGGQANQTPTWTPDSRAVTFASNRGDGVQLFSRPVDRSRETEQLVATEGTSLPGSWTPDGQTLVYYAVSADNERDIWKFSRNGGTEPFLATEFNERAPRLSPNGKWVAYTSNQPGENRVFVQAFPSGGEVFPVSVGPGQEAVWSRDGRELFYRNGDQLWVVEVETEPGFAKGIPRVLFEKRYDFERNLMGTPNYDVSLDGQRFLMVASETRDDSQGYVVVLNWLAELKRLVPVN